MTSGLFPIAALLVSISVSAHAEFKPVLKPYKVAEDLSNVANLAEFTDAVNHYRKNPFDLSPARQELLARNAFVVTPGDAEQFFQIYESEHYGMRPRIPNFLTADVALHLYHLIYDFSLKGVEVEYLLPALSELTDGMLAGSLDQYETIADSSLRAAAMRNICYFAVASRLLGGDPGIPQECFDVVEEEISRIEQHQGSGLSTITGAGIDYTQFIVRGHYTHSHETEIYFKTMMWYQQASLELDPVKLLLHPMPLLQAMLMAANLYLDESQSTLPGVPLDKINSIIYLYVGESNNLDPHGFLPLLPHQFKDDLDAILGRAGGYYGSYGKATIREFAFSILDRLRKLPPAKISRGEPPKFSFFSQKYMIDTGIMQALTRYPERIWPKGLDVMAALGSTRAAIILDDVYREGEKWQKYPAILDSLTTRLATYDNEWSQSLSAGWLHMLQILNRERGEGYPSFMQNEAWTDKTLNTSLASWAEMRHDVILYATPSYAEGGNGADEIKQPKGYIEPLSDFYAQLLWQIQQNRRLLTAAGYLSNDLAKVLVRYEDMVKFFKDVSVKELAGQRLTEEEYERIRNFGVFIEMLTLDILRLDIALPIREERVGQGGSGSKPTIRDTYIKGWYQVTGPSRDLACIADVHNALDSCLEVAAGHLDIIYVVVPIEGKLCLTRGGVLSYYEFIYPQANRLNDEAWQEQIKRGRAPERQVWTKSFLAP